MAAIQEVQLAVLPGVETVSTDIPTKTMQLRYDPKQVSIEKIEGWNN
jgi:copper chaperone CopZ